MADRQVGNHAGVTVRSIRQSGGASASDGFDDADMLDLAAMRTRLAAINGAVYTAARLNTMSVNDMIYALRVADNPTTI